MTLFVSQVMLIIGYFLSVNKKSITFGLFCIISFYLVLLIGTRGNYGDYSAYEYYYNKNIYLTRFEPAWNYMVMSANYLGLNFRSFVFIVAFCSISMKAYFCWGLSRSPAASMALIISLIVWADLGQFRNALSYAVFLMGLTLSFKQRITCHIFIIGSIFIHYFTLLIVISYYFLKFIHFRKAVWHHLFSVALLASHFISLKAMANTFTFIPGFDRLLGYLVNSDLSYSAFSTTKLVYTSVGLFLLWLSRKIDFREVDVFIINLVVALLIFGNFFAEVGVVYTRIWGLYVNGLLAIVGVSVCFLFRERASVLLGLLLVSIAYNFIFFGDMIAKFRYVDLL